MDKVGVLRSFFLGKKKLIYVFLLLVWAEILSYAALVLISKKYPLLVYRQGSVDAEKVSNNLDDRLGWGSDNVQASNPKVRGCRLLLFGDSFVEADTYKQISVNGLLVTPEDYLAKLTGCDVLNYGVGGYGSDQAYFKFKKLLDEKKIRKNDYIYVGHLSENILRNINRNRSLLYPVPGDSTPLLKPVFESCSPECKFVPLPSSLQESDLSLISSVGVSPKVAIGEADHFIPDKLLFGSPVTVGFPNLFSLLRVPFVWHAFPRLAGVARHDQFYAKGNRGYVITKSIIKKFHSDCQKIECKAITSDVPVAGDFAQYFRKKRHSTQQLNNELAELGLRHFSLTDHLIQLNPGLQKNTCLLHDGSLDGGDLCNAHFNQIGYKQFFDFIAGHVNRF